METEDSVILLEKYTDCIRLLTSAFSGYPREALDHKPSAGAWSLRQILAHLIDHELNVSLRIRYIIAEPNTTIIPYDQDLWSNELDYDGEETQPMLEIFALLRQRNTRLLQRLPSHIWERNFIHPKWGNTSLRNYLNKQYSHLQSHLRQMERAFLAWLKTQPSQPSFANK